MIESTTDEGEGNESMRRPERIVGDDVERALLDKFVGEAEEGHGDGEGVAERSPRI